MRRERTRRESVVGWGFGRDGFGVREGLKVLSTKTIRLSRARAGTEGIRGVNVTAEAPYFFP